MAVWTNSQLLPLGTMDTLMHHFGLRQWCSEPSMAPQCSSFDYSPNRYEITPWYQGQPDTLLPSAFSLKCIQLSMALQARHFYYSLNKHEINGQDLPITLSMHKYFQKRKTHNVISNSYYLCRQIQRIFHITDAMLSSSSVSFMDSAGHYRKNPKISDI